ncbi:MAG: hypothetical protein J6O55_02435 [Lachnospiraceae bacterium]|nr:hypothetical protein [Lachnospiraceae bacterium]
MGSKNNDKIIRQISLYSYITSTFYHGPDDLMGHFGINRRMLQRDLKDLRDAGIIRLKYYKKDNNYVESDTPAVFDESATGRHRQHLMRLKRLTTLIDKLPRTPMYDLETYESEYRQYLEYKEYMAEDPVTFPPEDLWEPPEKPVWENIKSVYYELFPNSNERMRQRDFQALNDAGFYIHYERKYRNYIFEANSDI